MDKKISFIEELNNQLKEYQIQKIVMAEEKNKNLHPRLNENMAKETLMDLGDLNDSTELDANSTSICRWNNKRDYQNPQQVPIITKRNNLLTQRYRSGQSRLEPLRALSTRQIPQLKQLLQKLSTPTNKKKRKPEERGVLTSARRNKNQNYDEDERILVPKYQNNIEQHINQAKGVISERKPSSRTKTLEKKDCENKNPILYPVNESIKQKSRVKQYQKINRKASNQWSMLKNSNQNQLITQKQLLQNLIKNTISNPAMSGKINSQAALSFLGQYSNLNYFSSNFKNQEKKKGTLTNLLI